MQTQPGTRKRPAPGTSPPAPQQSVPPVQPQNDFDMSRMTDQQFLDMANFPGMDDTTDTFDPLSFNTDFSMPQQNAMNMQNVAPNNQLVRRNTNQQLARHRGYTPLNSNTEDWPDFGNNGSTSWQHDEDDEELDRRAAEAKREAQSKRNPRPIPPFIQKLRSFLDNGNTNLIQWTADGDSFVVLDEDEFARTMIPHFFKTNKYASFVRQLNMYGFHKKVGLADNSMRASEKKAKNPSEYYNPYFKKGRPELLWLIQKPKDEQSDSKKKIAKKEEPQEGEEQTNENRAAARINAPGQSTDLVSMPRSQWQSLQREIEQLKRSQQQINNMIGRFQHENTNYIRQASVQHERHENSINAILTFLATFYHRNLDQGAGMFPGSIPNNQPQSGNVYDMSEFEEAGSQPQNQLQRLQKKPLAILPPPSWSPDQGKSSATESASPAPKLQNKNVAQQANLQPPSPSRQRTSASREPASVPRSTNSPMPKREPSETPTMLDRYPIASSGKARHVSTPSHDDILSAINEVNANSDTQSHNIDFSSALRQYENADGNAPLTPEQRDNMLNMIASTSGTTNPNQLMTKAGGQQKVGGNKSNNLEADLLNQFNSNREQLDMLQRLQQEQDNKVQALADRIQPLSPSGSIPGLNLPSSQPGSAYGGDGMGNPGDFDIDSFINSDYFPEFDGNTGNNDNDNSGAGNGGNFNFDEAAQQGADESLGDDGLFGDDPNDGGASNSPQPPPQDDGQAWQNEASINVDGAGSPAFAGGRIVGSVASSSGAPTPNAVAADNDGGSGEAGSSNNNNKLGDAADESGRNQKRRRRG